jgi:hypothetical protein
MNLPFNLGSLDFADWIRGLVGGFIAGGAGAVTSGPTLALVDPEHFNVHTAEFYQAVGAIFLSNGLVGAMLFLHQKPLPAAKTVTVTAQQKTVTPTGATTVTNMQQTTVEPVAPPAPVPSQGETK